MVRDDGTRHFVQLSAAGDEMGEFSGSMPRQAALKAAQRIDPAENEDTTATETIQLRERGADTIHIFEGWAWTEEAPEDSPDWISGTITRSNVSKQGTYHLDSDSTSTSR